MRQARVSLFSTKILYSEWTEAFSYAFERNICDPIASENVKQEIFSMFRNTFSISGKSFSKIDQKDIFLEITHCWIHGCDTTKQNEAWMIHLSEEDLKESIQSQVQSFSTESIPFVLTPQVLF